ncbi:MULTISPECIES: vWA domain-containing protein [Aequorivita]|uniref:VWA domain-containing protein n=1 Tax=Aequorivita iocasae TaxID=2803865 RepID=A0ABX7DQT1_9FLAO|nr:MULTISPECIES: VWA domain-containing protein [Aequorivita]QQX76438.1 VWA domain-containing protein [Aequorivita iocasae]UCA55910.1 VWA domain-containing protein [Aequorivita sp. F7]
MKQLATILCLLLFSIQLSAQPEVPSPIIFIYDASGSMWGQMQGKTKMEIATEVLTTTVNKLPANQNVGLDRKKGDCKDVETLVSMENNSKSEINSALKNIKPLGMTPLAYAASQVIDGLRKSKKKATIILITDGIESCNGNICEIVTAAKKEGIDFRLHIVGFGLKANETEQLKCAANAGDGKYYDAADASGLDDVLTEATAETVDKPKGNVSVFAVKNGVAIDAWVKAYDVVAKRAPISVRTYKDTAYFYLPPSKYNFEVTPLEGSDVKMVTVEGIQSFEDKIIHKTISFDGGKIGVTTTNNGKNWDCMVKVLDANGKTVASLRTYNEPKEVEVNPGVYKVSIQALGDMKGLETYTEIENVKVEASGIRPVSHNFTTGTAFIDAKADGNSIDSVVTIDESPSGKNVAGGRTYSRGKQFLLNPGTYKVKVAPLGNYKDRKTQTITIEVKKGESITKTLNF